MKNLKNGNTDEIVVIKPIERLIYLDLREIWKYRELFFVFTWRDIKVRYKQTFLGVLWAIIPPVLSMIVFTVIFGNFLSVPSDSIPYPIFVYTGALIWSYFSAALTRSSNSLVSHSRMIQKVYFPRIILPLSSIISGLLDFVISFGVLVLLMIYFQVLPGIIGILILPLLLLITILSSLGMGLFLSSLNVRYRDVGYILPFFIQTLFFLTPVVYPVTILQDWDILLWFNPMTSVIENMRAGLLLNSSIDWTLLFISVLVSFFYFFAGVYYFRRVEKDFADII